MTLAENIATEIMNTIERERRVNKDDLIAAAERALMADARGRYKLALAELAACRLHVQPLWPEREESKSK